MAVKGEKMRKLLLMLAVITTFVFVACGNPANQKNDTSAKADTAPAANSSAQKQPDKPKEPIVEKAEPVTVWLQVDGMTKVQGIT